MADMNKEFNEALRAKLVAAGYTDKEIVYGTLTAEVSTGLKLLKTVGPRGYPIFLALSATMLRVLVVATMDAEVDPTRCVAVSDMVQEAVMNKAADMLRAARQGQPAQGEQPAQEQPAGEKCPDCGEVHGDDVEQAIDRVLNDRGPTDPSQIN
jgi:hypothetical protein